MVAIVSGNSLGLDLTSLRTLGAQEFTGHAANGRSGEGVYVNVANGNLVLQRQDGAVAAVGADLEAVRTYNSQGLLNDDNGVAGDNWTSGFYLAPLAVTGTPRTAGSTIQRTGRDGAVSTFTWDARGFYSTTDGDGAYDTITLNDAGTFYTWRDGATGSWQRYQSSGAHRLVSSGDSAGNVLTYSYDADGRIDKVVDADGAGTKYHYGASWTELRTIQGAVEVTRVKYDYDAEARLVRVTVDLSPDDAGMADGDVYWTQYGYDGVSKRVRTLAQSDGTQLTFGYTTDGRIASVTNGLNETTTFAYSAVPGGTRTTVTDALGGNTVYDADTQGRLTRIAAPAFGGVTPSRSFAYDEQGNVRIVTDGTGRTETYEYDDAGNVLTSRDPRGYVTRYAYDAAEQVTEIRDSQTKVNPVNNAVYPVKVTTYAYDLSGRRLLEKTVAGTAVYQDNHLAYDAQGRLREVSDARVRMLLDYDANGNRIKVSTTLRYAGLLGEVNSPSTRYFTYDAMNRQLVVDAIDAAGTAGMDTHILTYDKNGNRLTDTYKNYAVVKDAAQNWTVSEEKVQVTEAYQYDDLNRLIVATRDGIAIDRRSYDAADRVLASGTTLGAGYREQLERLRGVIAQPDKRVNRYDANGRLLHQTVKAASGALLQEISWDPAEAPREVHVTQAPAARAEGYDHAGNVEGYTVFTYEGSRTTKYSTTLERYEGYVGAQSTVTEYPSASSGTNKQIYDANGHLVRVEDHQVDGYTRSFVNDAEGRALYTLRGAHEQRQFIVNGEVLGRYGVGVNEIVPTEGNGTPNFTNVADFNFSFSRISATHPAPSPGAYVVQAEDTLQTIARSAYGDAALWYRLADANGLASNDDVRVGQVLNIPNRVGTIHNNEGTFKPYDPSKITGDVTPHLPIPKADGCGAVGQVLMIVVAVVAAYFTAGAALSAFGTATGLSTSAVAGATFIGEGAISAVASGLAEWSVGSLVMAGAAGGAAASVSSQFVGLATGVQDRFDWKGVALSTIGGGMSMGIAGFEGSGGLEISKNVATDRVIQTALSSALSQGVGAALNLQHSFNWRAVAASVTGAAVGQAAGVAFSATAGGSAGVQFAGRMATSLVAGAATAVARGGRVAVQQVAVDAFGNALGSSLAEALGPQPESIYSLASGDSGQGFWPSTGGGVGLSYGGARATAAGAADPGMASDYVHGAYDQLVGAIDNYQRVDDDDPVLLAANGGMKGGVAPLGSSARNYRNQMDIASDNAATARIRAAGTDSSSSLLGAIAGVGTSFGGMAASAARVGRNLLMQGGDILTGGFNHDHPMMQQVWAEQRALGTGIVNLVSSPVATVTDLIEGGVHRYDAAMAQPTNFDRSYELGRLFNDAGQSAIGGGLAIRGVARLGAGTRPLASVEAVSGGSAEIVGDFTSIKFQGDRVYALVPSNDGAGPLRWIRTDRIDPAPSVHGNSLGNPNPTHIYALRDESGAVWKIGESARGTNGLGLSIRAEQQVRDLNLLYPDKFFKSEIRAWQPDKAAGRAYETRVIDRYRSMYGQDTLPGNLTNR